MDLRETLKNSIYHGLLLVGRAVGLVMQFRRSRYDYVIYKVDRIGDWFIAQGAIEAIVRATPGRGLLLVSTFVDVGLVAKYIPGIEVRQLQFKNEGVDAVLANFRTALSLACSGAPQECIVLRHRITPLREFFLRIVSAKKVTLVDETDRDLQQAYPWLRPRRGRRATVVEVPASGAESAAPGYAREHLLHGRVLQRHLGLTGPVDFRTRLVSATRIPQVVVCPFGSAKIRDYPPAAWAELIEGVCRRFNLTQVVFPVTASAVARTQELIGAMKLSSDISVSLADSPSLDAFVEIIGSARYVLTVESAAAHIAAAFDREGVVLIGGGHYGLYGPWGFSGKLKWVTHRLDCFGCNWRCVRSEVECITKIKPAQILAEIAGTPAG